MNGYVLGVLKAGLVYSVIAGVFSLIVSVIARLASKKKATLRFCIMRFSKGFFAVALLHVYMLLSLKYKFTPSGTIGSVLDLLIIVAIVVSVHKLTQLLEGKKEPESKNGCLITFVSLIGLIFVAIIGAVIYAVNSQ